MEEIFIKIKNKNTEKVPEFIRTRIYRNILFIKFKPYFYSLIAIFLGSFAFLSNHIYRGLVETESISVIKVLIQDFELSFDYFSNSYLSLNEILPKKELILLAINSLAIVSLLEIFRQFKNKLLKTNN